MLLRFRVQTAFIILCFYISTVSSCMPGYEGEREKLRQYLGIEWVPNGLKEMDAQKHKAVRHPEELNCDFTDPSKCRWMNNKNLDTLNFHLFEKQDHTVFPALQVRPGPSKLEPGDKLIFVGDKKKKDQSALITSWPIRCQNTTGKLTFNFWVFNGANVEVIILEENMDTGVLQQSGEKIYVDCGTVTMNTECTVDIPPRELPFRIGIRAYDINNPEGSFVMVDNIYYYASFCKVSIEFGPNFKTENLMTGADGMPVENSHHLNCDDFDKTCRWRNGGHGKRIWKKAITAPSEQLMFNETGTYTVPQVPFAFMYIEEDSKKDDFMALISDPITCQSATSSTISFRLWATKGVQMSICTMNFEMKPIECQKISMGRSPAPSIHHFEQTNDFMYGFRVDSANPDFDNFVAIDDITYEATMCNEAINALDFGSNFYSTAMLSTLLNRPVQSSKDLECSFSKRALDCFWANLEGEKGQWEIGVGTIDKTKFASLTRRLTYPDTEFAVARLNQRNLSAVLASETIRCMSDKAVLSFRYWHTGAAVLSICIIKSISFDVIDCQSIGSVSNEHVYVDIPQMDETIRIALRADSLMGEGIIAIDDLKMEGKFCPTVAFSPNSGFGSKKSRRPAERHIQGSPDSNVCRLLSCNFDKENLCLYESKRVANSLSMFSVHNGVAHTMLFERSRVSMLESTSFHLNAAARLHFDYSIVKGFAQIFICEDSVVRELDTCYKVTASKQTEKGEFVHDFIEILPSDIKLYIIVKLEEGSRKASVRIDNISLTDIENHPIC
uniref:MAM domain-containing protein n=1 Tax=Panagrolaimus superbus TaxID=310955 RepID=A0A914Z293_9BILA